MGSATSKARNCPEAVSKVVQSGVKSRSIPSVTANKNRLAESHKSEAIERDATDPHFLANLNKLGPVKVDHHMRTIRPEATQAQTLFSSRASESEVLPQVTRNRLYASSISELLDRRKDVRTLAELEKLAEEFGIDVDVLNGLAKVVNSPSIDTGRMSFWSENLGDSHEEVVIAPAVWIEPSLKN